MKFLVAKPDCAACSKVLFCANEFVLVRCRCCGYHTWCTSRGKGIADVGDYFGTNPGARLVECAGKVHGLFAWTEVTHHVCCAKCRGIDNELSDNMIALSITAEEKRSDQRLIEQVFATAFERENEDGEA